MPGPKLKAPEPIRVTKPADIELGMQLREVVSGIEGIAWSRRETIAGTIMFALQPKGDGKTLPDAFNFDWQTLEILNSGVADRAFPEDPTVKINPGDKVKDKITGLVGVATEKLTYMNGCVHIHVRGKDTDKGQPRGETFEHSRLEVLPEPPVVLRQVAEKTVEQKEKPTGGPSVRAYRP